MNNLDLLINMCKVRWFTLLIVLFALNADCAIVPFYIADFAWKGGVRLPREFDERHESVDRVVEQAIMAAGCQAFLRRCVETNTHCGEGCLTIRYGEGFIVVERLYPLVDECRMAELYFYKDKAGKFNEVRFSESRMLYPPVPLPEGAKP